MMMLYWLLLDYSDYIIVNSIIAILLLARGRDTDTVRYSTITKVHIDDVI